MCLCLFAYLLLLLLILLFLFLFLILFLSSHRGDGRCTVRSKSTNIVDTDRSAQSLSLAHLTNKCILTIRQLSDSSPSLLYLCLYLTTLRQLSVNWIPMFSLSFKRFFIHCFALSICLFIRPSINLSVHVPICLSVCLSVHQSVFFDSLISFSLFILSFYFILLFYLFIFSLYSLFLISIHFFFFIICSLILFPFSFSFH